MIQQPTTLLPIIEGLLFSGHRPESIECFEQDDLNMGGFLIAYEARRVMVLNGQLSEEEKAIGRKYLVDLLLENPACWRGLYIWKGPECRPI